MLIRVLRRILRRGLATSQKGFLEGGFKKVPKIPPRRVRPLSHAPCFPAIGASVLPSIVCADSPSPRAELQANHLLTTIGGNEGSAMAQVYQSAAWKSKSATASFHGFEQPKYSATSILNTPQRMTRHTHTILPCYADSSSVALPIDAVPYKRYASPCACTGRQARDAEQLLALVVPQSVWGISLIWPNHADRVA